MDNLQFACDLIKFDLGKGPFVTGSYMTWKFEKTSNWLPNDLDICCTTKEQFQQVKTILQPLSTDSKQTDWLGHSSTYWIINDFKFQAFVHPVSVKERLNFVDYTITAIAYDGRDYITNEYTLEDIKNKTIRLNKNIYKWPKDSIMYRYKKYLDRGYVDLNNTTLDQLNQMYETCTTF